MRISGYWLRVSRACRICPANAPEIAAFGSPVGLSGLPFFSRGRGNGENVEERAGKIPQGTEPWQFQEFVLVPQPEGVGGKTGSGHEASRRHGALQYDIETTVPGMSGKETAPLKEMQWTPGRIQYTGHLWGPAPFGGGRGMAFSWRLRGSNGLALHHSDLLGRLGDPRVTATTTGGERRAAINTAFRRAQRKVKR